MKLLALLLCALATPAWAQAPRPKVAPAAAPAAPATTAPAAAAPAPAQPQQPQAFALPDKRSTVFGNLTLVSLGYPTSGNVGLGIGFNVWKLLTFELEYLGGKRDLSLFNVPLGQIHQQVYGAHARVYPFLGAFNVSGFYGQRWLTATLDSDDVYTGTEVNVRQKVLGVGLGHRFHLGRLHLGFDWIMYYWPVTKGKVSSKILNQELSDADRGHVEDAADQLEKMPTVTLINLSLGLGV